MFFINDGLATNRGAVVLVINTSFSGVRNAVNVTTGDTISASIAFGIKNATEEGTESLAIFIIGKTSSSEGKGTPGIRIGNAAWAVSDALLNSHCRDGIGSEAVHGIWFAFSVAPRAAFVHTIYTAALGSR